MDDDADTFTAYYINGRICPLESADKLTNMSNRIQDTTYVTIFFAGINLFCWYQILPFIILIRRGGSIYRTYMVKRMEGAFPCLTHEQIIV